MEQSAYEFYVETWNKCRSYGLIGEATRLKNLAYKHYFDHPGVLLYHPSLELCDSDGDDPANHPWSPLCMLGEDPPTSVIPYDEAWLSTTEHYGIGIKCPAIGAPPYGWDGDGWATGTIYNHKVRSVCSDAYYTQGGICSNRFSNDAVDCTVAYWTHLVQTGTFYQVFKETGSWEECEVTIHGTCYWLVPTSKLEPTANREPNVKREYQSTEYWEK